MGDCLELSKYGIPPDVLQVLRDNYSDAMLQDFLPKYLNTVAQNKIEDDMRLADIIVAAVNVGRTKKGHQTYSKWRNQRIKQITDLKEELEIEKLTVFERLRFTANKGKRQTNTVFDRLKRVYKDGV